MAFGIFGGLQGLNPATMMPWLAMQNTSPVTPVFDAPADNTPSSTLKIPGYAPNISAITSQLKPINIQTNTYANPFAQQPPVIQPQAKPAAQPVIQPKTTQVNSLFDPRAYNAKTNPYDVNTWMNIQNSGNRPTNVVNAPNIVNGQRTMGTYGSTTAPQVYMPQTVQPGHFYNPTPVRPVLPTYFRH